MDREAELSVIRTAYAKQIMAEAGVCDARLEKAFAGVRRENFLGPGPWEIVRDGSYVRTPDADPAHIYTNDLIGIIPERQINNGEPSFHASLISRAAPADGEHVVHVGAGTGYYSAIFAELVGKDGHVTAVEYLPELAMRAKANLLQFSNVDVLQGDGAATPFRAASVVYVNAGATRPADMWLDQLRVRGANSVLMLASVSGRSKCRVVSVLSRNENEYMVALANITHRDPISSNVRGHGWAGIKNGEPLMTPPDPPKLIYPLAFGPLILGFSLIAGGLWLVALRNFAGLYSVFGATVMILLKLRTASTRVTEAGVSQLTLRGRVHLSWSEVTQVTRAPLSLTLAAAKRRVVVSLEEFADSAAAISYIESHIPANLRSV
jgi:protein-L-isoaspartate O-methyltransferase